MHSHRPHGTQPTAVYIDQTAIMRVSPTQFYCLIFFSQFSPIFFDRLRFYAPSFLIVATSFVGFWIPVIAWPGRVTVVVTPLLALITQQATISADLNVSYVVALHVWTMVSVALVFLCLVEYALAIVYANAIEDRKEVNRNSTSSSCHIRAARNACQSIGIALPDMDNYRSSPETKMVIKNLVTKLLSTVYGPRVNWSKNPLQRNKVDYLARIFFPALYCLFMLIYFLTFVVPWALER